MTNKSKFLAGLIFLFLSSCETVEVPKCNDPEVINTVLNILQENGFENDLGLELDLIFTDDINEGLHSCNCRARLKGEYNSTIYRNYQGKLDIDVHNNPEITYHVQINDQGELLVEAEFPDLGR